MLEECVFSLFLCLSRTGDIPFALARAHRIVSQSLVLASIAGASTARVLRRLAVEQEEDVSVGV